MKLFNKDFSMVLLGQIISLFGNAILRFALPLYLLNTTGSASLFGIVTACSFIPMIFATPIGGIFADRVNKRNIMVFLDFTTALIIAVISILLGKVNLVILILISLILLFAIQGIYQPAVQSSIPVLVPSDKIVQANSAINLVSSLSSLIGPILGGILFGFYGIMPILYISGLCFFAASMMEIFINIPFIKNNSKSCNGIFNLVFSDMKESFSFMINKRPEILKISCILGLFNLILSACVTIGLPVIVTQKIGFNLEDANKLYGYVEGAMGAGSLIGGILAGVLAKKIKVSSGSLIIILCGLTLVPIAIVLSVSLSPMIRLLIIAASAFIAMVLASFFSVQLLSCLQIITPNNILGKVISCVMCIVMCASPLGQALYGIAFQRFANFPQFIFTFSMILSVIIGILTVKTFKNFYKLLTVITPEA